MKVLITTVPFGDKNHLPIELLEQGQVEYLINPLGKRLTEKELAEMAADVDVIIAGTEPITNFVMSCAPKLKMISRVGIGLDSVDLLAAQRRGITVSYTPDAPAPAVAELTLGLMLSQLRLIHISNQQMHAGKWQRFPGRRLAECTIGIIGTGRVGQAVIRHLSGFNCKQILVNDLHQDFEFDKRVAVKWCDKEAIYKEADIISLHVPLTSSTRSMIAKAQLLMMKPDALVINTARGGIINEADLFDVLQSGHLCGAAIDVFEDEPYSGKLGHIDNCLLSSHMGSMTVDCRAQMEIEATQEALRFISGNELQSVAPEAEYAIQRESLQDNG